MAKRKPTKTGSDTDRDHKRVKTEHTKSDKPRKSLLVKVPVRYPVGGKLPKMVDSVQEPTIARTHPKPSLAEAARTNSEIVALNAVPLRASLLGMPAEIRNKIYELVLITGVVDVKTSTREPGILRACRVARKEARNIFLHRNRFLLDCVLLRAELHPQPLHWCYSTSTHVTRSPNCSGWPNWEGLSKFIKLVWEGRLGPDPRCHFVEACSSNRRKELETIFKAATKTTAGMQELPWENVRHSLVPTMGRLTTSEQTSGGASAK